MNAHDAPNQLEPAVNSVSAYGAPLDAYEVALTVYCSVATLAVSAVTKLPHTRADSTLQALVWTWVLCVPEEVEIVNRRGLSIPIIAYFATR